MDGYPVSEEQRRLGCYGERRTDLVSRVDACDTFRQTGSRHRYGGSNVSTYASAGEEQMQEFPQLLCAVGARETGDMEGL